MLKKNKKAVMWSEVAKWIMIGVLIIVVILAIINPTREAMFQKLEEFFDILSFGRS